VSEKGSKALDFAEQGLFPDIVVRLGIRQLLKERLIQKSLLGCGNFTFATVRVGLWNAQLEMCSFF
jgi:hypothetical protein